MCNVFVRIKTEWKALALNQLIFVFNSQMVSNRLLAILVICFLFLRADATHLVGGEFVYNYLGNGDYQLKLKVWRDCNSTTQFDDPAIVNVYDNTNTLRYTFQMYSPQTTFINPNVNNPCMIFPPGVCVEMAVYTMTVNLPPIPGGYTLSYQRCCRNNSIVNLSDPGNTGVTYIANIPDPVTNGFNSSPEFTNYPQIVICVNEPIVFDHSAIDPDGDSLVYSMCTPYQGGDAANPNPAFAPPYQNVVWQNPFNQANQLGGFPALSINSQTGLMTGTPGSLGNFVVGVCVTVGVGVGANTLTSIPKSHNIVGVGVCVVVSVGVCVKVGVTVGVAS